MYTYEELKTFVNHCRRCPLSETRNKAVMGQGNMASKMLFVAEAPGSSEDRAGIPFTGPSGHVFDELLAGIGMTRKDIYLTNIVKCHPPGNRDPRPEEHIPFTGPSGHVFDELLAGIGMTRKDIYLTNIVKCHPPGNRDPRPEEQEACINYLKYETYLIEPKIIVCLGRIAAQRIIEPNYRITRAHGSFLYRKGTWLTAVYHPSAICLIIELRGHMVLSYIERALG